MKIENNLTRAQAQIAFINGKKIGHLLFLDGEFVYLNNDNKMVDENENIINKMDFWLQRGKNQYDNGWFIID